MKILFLNLLMTISLSGWSMTCQEGMNLMIKEKSMMSQKEFLESKEVIKKEDKIQRLISTAKKQAKFFKQQKMHKELEKETARIANLYKWQQSIQEVKKSVSKIEDDFKKLQERVTLLCEIRGIKTELELFQANLNKHSDQQEMLNAKIACLSAGLNRTSSTYVTCDTLVTKLGIRASRVIECDRDNFWSFNFISCLKD